MTETDNMKDPVVKPMLLATAVLVVVLVPEQLLALLVLRKAENSEPWNVPEACLFAFCEFLVRSDNCLDSANTASIRYRNCSLDVSKFLRHGPVFSCMQRITVS